MLINAYFICSRKLWFFSRQISPDPEWEFLEIGRLISETAFQRDKKELTSDGMKIDVLKRRNKDMVVGEIKKSSKGLKSAIMQLAFYLYNLKKKGLNLKGE
ncbi:MAG: CRISPR-associated protein Cas4, partial [Candidatus Omnitrophica bacterium]|nr:CRISPR-associated protein Cas4 [Candidatus Omnitrophota bacterium]